MIEVWNHIHLQLFEVRCQSYSFLTLIIFIHDVDYDHLWRWLCLFKMWIMIISVKISIYVTYFFLFVLQVLIFQIEKKHWKVEKQWRVLRCSWVGVCAMRIIWERKVNNMCQERSIKVRWGEFMITNREGKCNTNEIKLIVIRRPKIYHVKKRKFRKWYLLGVKVHKKKSRQEWCQIQVLKQSWIGILW